MNDGMGDGLPVQPPDLRFDFLNGPNGLFQLASVGLPPHRLLGHQIEMVLESPYRGKFMLNRIRRITAAFCLVALVAGITLPLSASADESFINSSDTEANNMTSPVMLDLLVLRPIGLVTFCVSSVLFVAPVIPLTLITRPTELAKPFKAMVIKPALFVWADPLGKH